MVDRFISQRDILTSNNSTTKRTGWLTDNRKTVRRAHTLLALSAAAGIAGLLAPSHVNAATATKANNTTNLNDGGSWVGGNAGNTTPGNGQPGGADIALFNNTITAANATSLGDSAQVWGEIQVTNPGGAITIGTVGDGFSLQLNGIGGVGIDMSAATQNLTFNSILNLGASAQSWNIATGHTFTLAGALNQGTDLITTLGAGNVAISGAITGSGGLTLGGTGAVTLTGANTGYTGITTLNSGTLNIGNTNALGTGGSASAFIINGGTLNTSGGAQTLSSNNAITIGGSFAFTGTNSLNMGTGTVTLTGATGPTITVNNNQLEFDGAISGGSLALTKAGNGTLVLGSTTNTYGATILNAGNIAITADSAIPGGLGAITWGGGGLQFNNYTTAFTFNSIANLRLGGGPAGASGTVPGGNISGTSAPTFQGQGTLILAGPNTYSGVTTINSGVVQISAISDLGTNPALNFGGGTLQYAGGLNADLSTAKTVTLNAGGGTLDINGTNVTFNSILNGTGGFGVTSTAGAATLTLNAANTVAGGNMTVGTNATVFLGNALALQNATLNLTAGNVDFGTQTNVTLGGLAGATNVNLANDSANPVNLTLGANTASYTGILGGTNITLTKNGAGAQTMSGANTFTGNTIVNAGTLTLSNTQSNISFTVNGGTLALTTVAQTLNQNFAVNSGTLTLNAAQGPLSTIELNTGTTLTSNQVLGPVNIITALAGTSTLTSTSGATFNALLAGNGNVTASFSAGLNTVSANMLSDYGGIFSLGATNNFGRVAADTTSENFVAQFATLDLGTGSAALNARNSGDNIEIGGLTGGANTALTGPTTSGGIVYTIGSSNADSIFAGQINNNTTFTSAVVKVGSGTLTLTDAKGTIFTDTAGVTVNGGTLKLDYSNSPTGIFGATNALNIGGGSLYLLGKNTGATTQTLGNLTLTGAGGNSLIVDPNGGTSTTLTLGTITQTANGGTLNIQPPNVTIGSGTATITTTSNVSTAGATYGARLTYGSDWATTASGTGPFILSAYSAYNTLPAAFAGAVNTTNDQINSTTGNVVLTTAYSANSLKINPGSGQSLDLGGQAMTLNNGGLLFTGGNNFALGLGVNPADSLKSGSASPSDLIVQQLGTGNLTIGAPIINGAGTTNASVLTKAGFGTLTLTADNGYTGVTNLNGGILSISSDSNIGGNNGTIGIATSLTTSANVTLSSATLPVGFGPGSNLLGRTVTSVNGTAVVLNGNAGTALTGSTASFITGANLDMNGGTLQATASFSMTESNTGGSAGTTTGSRNVLLFGGGGTFDVTAGNNLTIPGTISENNIFQFGELKKTDAGTLTLSGNNTYGGATVISGGVLSIGTITNGAVIAGNGSGKSTANGSATVTLPDTAGITAGMSVFGNGIPAGATVLSVTPNTNITLSANATVNGTTPLTFFTPNSLGSSPNVADALVLDGGTLRYTGPTASTDRTFTVTPNGGTIDGSGVGPVNFSSPWAIGVNIPSAGSGARTLTLAGSTAANTFAGQIVDGVGGVTGLTKAGPGSWILTNTAHTYTGATTITGGTLSLSSTSTNPIATSNTIKVGSGAILDATLLPSSTIALGTQTLTGAGTVNGTVAAGSTSMIAPGTITSGSAGTGTLTTSNLTLATGSTLDFGLSSANLNGSLTGAADLISTGALTLATSGITNVEFYQPNTSSPFLTPGTYDLIQFSSLSGTPSLHLAAGPVTGSGAFSYAFNTSGNFLTVTLTQNAVAATWANDISGNWSTPTSNWTGGVPTAAGDSATFGAVITAPRTVTLDTNETVGQITFNVNNVLHPTASYTIAEPSVGGPFTLTLNNKGNGVSIMDQSGSHQIGVNLNLADSTTVTVNNASDTITMSGTVNSSSGTPSLTKAGLGTLILSNTSNNYAGNTNVNGGVLRFFGLSSLGTGANINFGGGTLQYASTFSDDISTRNITLNAGGGTVDTNGSNVAFNHPIGNAGPGGFTKAGAGTLTLTQTNTYTGNSTISGGTLSFAALNNLGAGTGITVNGGALQWATGNTADISTRTVTVAAGGGSFDANGNPIAFSGPIGNGGTGGLTLLSSAANGSFTFNQASAYSGNTTINAVPVTLNNGATLGSGSIVFQGTTGSITSGYTAGNVLGLPSLAVGSGVVATVTGSNRTSIGGLTGSGTLNIVTTALPTLATGNYTGTAFTGGDFSAFSGTINISSNSSANNAFVLAFNNGGNNFNGNMPLATVNLTNNVRLSATNNTTGNTWTIGALSGDSTSIIGGSDFPGNAAGLTIAVGAANINTTFAGQITNGDSGTGGTNITKQGTAVFTLSNGTSTYNGTNAINAGTLRVTNTSGSATGFGPVNVNNGGTLSGTGIISGQAAASPVAVLVTVADGGIVAPEHFNVATNTPNNVGPISAGSIPTLSMDALTLNAPTGASAPILNFELTAPASPNPNGSTPGTSDLINVTQPNSLTINGGIVNVFDSTTGAVFSTPGTYDLMEYNSGVGGSGVGALSLGAAELAVPNTNYLITAPGGANPFIQLVISANPTNFWTNGTGDSTWVSGDTGNWLGGTVPNGSTAIADFDDSHYHVPGAAQNVSLGGTIVVGQLIFNSTPKVSIGSGNINFDNGSAAAIISDTNGTHSIAANLNIPALGLNIGVTKATDALTISGQVVGGGPMATSGAGNITFAGAINATALNINGTGTVVLAADNSNHAGPTTVNSGTLALLNQNSLDFSVLGLTGSGAVTFAPGIGTYFLGGLTTGNIAMQDTATPTPGVVNLDVGGGIGFSFTYSGVLSGNGNLIKDGGGAMTLTNSNTFGGNVTINNGTIVVAANPAYGTAATVTTVGQNGTLTVNPGDSFGGTLVMLNNSTLNFVGTTSAGTFVGNNMSIASGATATIESTLQTSNGYAGMITFAADGTSTATIFGNQGTGTTVPQVGFSASTSQFSGIGTFVIPNSQTLRWSSTTLNNGSPNVLFDIEGTMTTRNNGAVALGSLIGFGTLESGGTGPTGSNVNYSIGGNNADSTFNGLIADNYNAATSVNDTTHQTFITKVGTGTLTLNHSNIYSGNTNVTAGTLIIPSGASLASINTNVSGGVMDLTGTLTGGPNVTAVVTLPNVSASGTGILNADNNNNQNGTPFVRNWGTVTVGTGATGGRINLTNSPNGQVNRTVLVLGSPTVAGTTTFTAGGTGVLDLNSNDMIVLSGATPAAGLTERATLAAAANTGLNNAGGAWAGTGLVTSSGLKANNPNTNTGLAIVVNDTNQSGTLSGTPLMGTFDSQSVSDGDVLVKYTYFGDALLTGSVIASDYTQIDNGFASQTGANPLQGWYNGDFNYDGKINGDDYSLIDNAFNTQGTAFPTTISAGPAEMIATNTSQIAGAGVSAVPEPTTLTMLGIGAAGLLTRRRRRNA